MRHSSVRLSHTTVDNVHKAAGSAPRAPRRAATCVRPGWPSLLRGRDILIDARRHGGKDRRAEGAALIGGDDIQRTVHYVAADLHDGGDLRAMPPSVRMFSTGIRCCSKHSIMARAPKAVAAIKPPNSVGASVPRFRSVITPSDADWRRSAAAVKPVQHHRQMIELRIRYPCVGQLAQQILRQRIELRLQFRLPLRRQL